MIYLDNAATTYPKPFSVLETVYRANRKYAYNSGRGGYRESVQTAEKILLCGTAWAAFSLPGAEYCVYQQLHDCSEYGTKGLLKPGDHVLISALEHNAVFRPIYKLAREGVSPTIRCRITRTRTAFTEYPGTGAAQYGDGGHAPCFQCVWGGAPAGLSATTVAERAGSLW